ncbi:EF-P lysine aminoacylase EpmA [Arenimonas sp. GDDSR-1]|uniref:EF-P lysine aminoacylase EpmA n=1 Tax=Arenimonas sp. GDDSR-1 TaxID=2950125 RepID=UPI002612EC4F|nr:EF-P lysine aminoacylase EpmA [Arenimonas sp. GDDSR-1]
MTDWRATALPDDLRRRAAVYRHIREFFHARGVLEVETPVLSQAGNTDPNIASFHLEYSGPSTGGNRRRWLRTSPEFPLKRLLAGGIGDCYEIGKVFRDGEFGRRHNPEFSMLEWYRVGWNHLQLAEEAVTLLQELFASAGKPLRVRDITYRDLFREAVGLDPHLADGSDLAAAVSRYIRISQEGLGRDDLLDLLLTHVIEPAFADDQLTVIRDFPASQCALAKLRVDDVPVAERFEIYLGATELANGYHELNDADEQRDRFEKDLLRRLAAGSDTPALDDRLLQSLASLPDCAGIAMGLDRLLLCLLGKTGMSEVIAFDFSRA